MVNLDDLKKYCRGKWFSLSDDAEKIYAAIKKRNGCCPCRVNDVMCPCPDHLEELELNRRCKCGLFVANTYDPFPSLLKKFPDLFDIGGYFISCGYDKGWKDIVEEALEKIQKLNKKLDECDIIKIIQIKEKFGGLRIYTNIYNDDAELILKDAERKAKYTCECCGSHNNVTSKGSWIKTYCEKCHQKLQSL